MNLSFSFLLNLGVALVHHDLPNDSHCRFVHTCDTPRTGADDQIWLYFHYKSRLHAKLRGEHRCHNGSCANHALEHFGIGYRYVGSFTAGLSKRIIRGEKPLPQKNIPPMRR